MAGKTLYYEDFTPGQQFKSGTYTIDLEHAIAFAKEYDPQYFHTDIEAAKNSIFGRLSVSGFQTTAISMRLKAGTDLIHMAGGLVGLGHDSMKWPRAVYPGDTLHLTVTITGKRKSNSRPGMGLVQYKMETFNQKDELVMEVQTTVLAPLRP